jgi:hypothetical protein
MRVHVFKAAVQPTEEAIVNAVVAAETVTGASALRVEVLPEDQVRAIFTDRSGITLYLLGKLISELSPTVKKTLKQAVAPD